MTSSYKALCLALREHAAWDGIHQLLDWDSETMIPPAGESLRGWQYSLIGNHIHQKKLSAPFRRKLAQCIDLASGTFLLDLSDREQANVREAWREWKHAAALPKSWTRRFMEVRHHSLSAWDEAKRTRTFATFRPWLERLVVLNQEKAKALGFSSDPYDALLDLHEPGMTWKILKPLFDQLSAVLVPLRQKALEAPPLPFMKTGLLEEQQLVFCRSLVEVIGCPPSSSRIDLSRHPFCLQTSPYDVRMTTRLSARGEWSPLYAALHEGGHALYDLGLSPEEWGLAGGTYGSMGLHESQSRLWECRVGLSLPFLQWLAPRLHAVTAQHIDPEALYKSLNRVEKGFIRIEADEVSYNLHILLRTQLEQALISGSLAVKDLPSAWADLSRELFGEAPPHDAEGCLQDIHWAFGEFGYFPTYTLGNLYASQLWHAFLKSEPQALDQIRFGDFEPLRLWLSKHVWSWGRTIPSKDLILKATGKEPSPVFLLEDLQKKVAEQFL